MYPMPQLNRVLPKEPTCTLIRIRCFSGLYRSSPMNSDKEQLLKTPMKAGLRKKPRVKHTCTGWTGLGAGVRPIFSLRVSIFSIIFSMLGPGGVYF